MPLFTGTATNQAPLIIQLQATSTSVAEVTSVSAIGSTTTGSAARPVLYRPITAGTPNPTQAPNIKSVPDGVSSLNTLAVSFSANPTLPTVSTGVGNLPIRTEWHSQGIGTGIFVMLSGAIVLYGSCSGGMTVSGAISWEDC